MKNADDLPVYRLEPEPQACCPKCRSTSSERIKRAIIIKMLSKWFPVRRYRCHKCSHKYYMKKSPSAHFNLLMKIEVSK